jgi:DNA-binding MarR family transcriptional regulator
MRVLFQHEDEEPLADLPVAQLRVMRILFAGKCTPSSLSESLNLTMSAVTQLCNRLEALGLVARTEDATDRRIRWLSLSETGHEKMAARQQRRVQRAHEVLSSIPADLRVSLVTALEELLIVSRESHATDGLVFPTEVEAAVLPSDDSARMRIVDA